MAGTNMYCDCRLSSTLSSLSYENTTFAPGRWVTKLFSWSSHTQLPTFLVIKALSSQHVFIPQLKLLPWSDSLGVWGVVSLLDLSWGLGPLHSALAPWMIRAAGFSMSLFTVSIHDFVSVPPNQKLWAQDALYSLSALRTRSFWQQVQCYLASGWESSTGSLVASPG